MEGGELPRGEHQGPLPRPAAGPRPAHRLQQHGQRVRVAERGEPRRLLPQQSASLQGNMHRHADDFTQTVIQLGCADVCRTKDKDFQPMNVQVFICELENTLTR